MLALDDRTEQLRDDLARLRVLAETPEFPTGVTMLAAAGLTFAMSLEVCQVLSGRRGLGEHARLIRHAAMTLETPDETRTAAAVAELRHLLTELSFVLELPA